MAEPDSLSGLRVVVTRPAHQAQALCERIEAAGGTALRFPVLEIHDPSDKDALLAVVRRLAGFDIAIFISPNAVERALAVINAHIGGLPNNVKIAAVGRASAKALSKYGVHTDLFPKQRFNSEALLELPQLQQVEGKKIVIFRGEGGRELLAETLSARGAEIEYAECYRRAKPATDIGPLLHHWARDEVDIIVITSAEGLENLFDMVGALGRKWLIRTPLLVVSERIGPYARQLGFELESIVADNASDDAIMAALGRWWHAQH